MEVSHFCSVPRHGLTLSAQTHAVIQVFNLACSFYQESTSSVLALCQDWWLCDYATGGGLDWRKLKWQMQSIAGAGRSEKGLSLVVTGATLVVTSALLAVTRSY